jgi:hypothetical protein
MGISWIYEGTIRGIEEPSAVVGKITGVIKNFQGAGLRIIYCQLIYVFNDFINRLL